MSRPCWYMGMAWFIACLIGAWLSLNVLIAVSVCGVIAVVLTVIVPSWCRRRTLLLIVLSTTAAFLFQTVRYTQLLLPMQRKVDTSVTLHTQVYKADGEICLRVLDGDLPSGTRLQLWKGDPHVEITLYDMVDGTFTLREFDEQGLSLMQQRARRVWFAVSPKEIAVSRGERPWTAVFGDLRRVAVGTVTSRMNGDPAALITGICFGADEKLSVEAQNDFRAAGVSHIFSVSGFHMVFLSQALALLFRRLRLRRLVRAMATIVTVLVFMGMVGLEAAVVRSGVMCLMVLLGDCFRRQSDVRNSLGLSLLILLIDEPFAAYDVSLLLSFCATFGLVLLFPKLKAEVMALLPDGWWENRPRLRGMAERLIEAICLTVSATVVTFPISILYFGEISLAAVIGNLLTSVPSTVLMALGCVGSLFSFFPLVAEPCFVLAGCLGHYLLFITEKISTFLPATVAITDRYLLLWMIEVLALVWFGYRIAQSRGVWLTVGVGLCTLVLSVSAHRWLMKDVATVRVFPCDGELAVCVQQYGHTALICAPQSEETVYTVLTSLRRYGIGRLDALALVGTDETAAAMTAALLDEQLENTTVLCSEQSPSVLYYMKNSVSLNKEERALWAGARIGIYESFVTLSIGETRWLFCTDDTSVRAMPNSLWRADAIVCSKKQPPDLPLLVGDVGIFPREYRDIPPQFDIEQLLTVGDADLILMTRGAGDIERK